MSGSMPFWTRWAVTIALVVCHGACHAAPPDAGIGWKTLKQDGITLDYLPQNEHMAHELVSMLPNLVEEMKKATDAGGSAGGGLMKTRRDECLDLVAHQIGMSTPGPTMKRTYAQVLRSEESLVGAVRTLHSFRLWPRELLLAKLRRGDRVPGCSYDAADDNVVITKEIGGSHGVEGFTPYPLVAVSDDDCVTTYENAADGLRSNPLISSEYNRALVVFHEAAESGLVGDVGLQSSFRRWFCDGVAQWAAETAVRRFYGEEGYSAVAGIYAAACDDVAPEKVDLLGWRAAESEDVMPHTPGVVYCDAHYGYALREIRGLEERHGAGTIARIVKQLRQLPRGTADSTAILTAIRRATGEDFGAVLAKYGAKADDKFRGIALSQLRFRILGQGQDTKTYTLDALRETSIPLGAACKVELSYHYERLPGVRPFKLSLVLGNPTSGCHVDITTGWKPSGSGTMRMALPRGKNGMAPGDYWLGVALNNHSCCLVPLKVTQGRGAAHTPQAG